MKYLYYPLLTIVGLLFMNTIAFGQPGVYDATFGNKGIAVLPFDLDFADLTILPNGKIIAAGTSNVSPYGFRIACFDAAGHLDSSFGTNGLAAVPTFYGPYPRTVAVQADGKILVTGDLFMAGSVGSGVVRLNVNGSVDSSFGINGFVEMSSPFTAVLTRALVKPNGKILLFATGNNSPFVIMQQLNSAGNPDTTFGNGGLSYGMSQIFGNSTVSNTSVALQPDGKMVVGSWVGYAWQGTSGISITRILPNGLTDSTFGLNGVAFYWQSFTKCHPVSMALQPDGKIVVAAFGSYDTTAGAATYVSVVRFNADGSADNTYGNNGQADAKVPVSPLAEWGKWEMTVQADGKALIAGGKYINAGYSQGMIARFNTNGTVDSAFGARGILASDLTFNAWQAIALQTDGKIVVGGPGILARFESNARTNYNYLTFETFLDRNFNSVRDGAEPLLSSYANITSSGGNTVYVSSSSGNFDVEVDTGIYVTKVNTALPYFNITPAAHTTSFSSYFNNKYFSFALQPIAGFKDVSIDIVPFSVLRPGFSTAYKVICINQATESASGNYRFIKDSRLTYIGSSPAPLSVNGDTLTWSYSNLLPFDTTGAYIYFTVNAPPVVNTGDTIYCSAKADGFAGEQNLQNNFAAISQIVRGSYDPNDKLENHGGKITLSGAATGEYLTYTIHFQNTGNDTAFNVYIRDTMDSKLDWNSLQIVASSHNYQMTMNDGKCLFTFPDIKLVDSNKNEAKSHGYIVYRIKAKPSIQIGNVIKNTAAIYFDYNLPVYTNTEKTTVVADVLPLKLLSFTAKKQEKTNLLNWTTAAEEHVSHFEVERSSTPNSSVGAGFMDFSKIGRVKAVQTQYSFIDEKPVMGNVNYYRLKMMDKYGQYTYSPIRMISNKGGFNVNIYPNPAKDVLQVEIEIDKKSEVQLLVFSGDGKVMVSKTITTQEGSSLQSINISALPKGSYLLKVTSAAKEDGIVKFEKM